MLEIFQHLPAKALFEVFLVSKEFNRLVSRSTKLMSKMKVNWKKFRDRGNRMFALRRNYVHLIQIKPASLLLKFIRDNSSTLSTLHFIDLRSKIFFEKEVYQILSAVAGTLKELDASGMDVDEQCLEWPKIEMKALERFYNSNYSHCSWFLISIISNNKLKFYKKGDISIGLHDDSKKACKPFLHFLGAQKRLKTLILNGSPLKFLLGNLKAATSFPFRLKTFKCYCDDDFASPHLLDFIETQGSSLEELNLLNAYLTYQDVHRLIAVGIKKIDFEMCEFPLPRRLTITNPAIECVSVTHVKYQSREDELQICDIIRSACNATTLKLFLTMTFDISLAISHGMEKLKSLELSSCIVKFPFWYPSVEEMKFCRIERRDAIKLVRANRQLKKVILVNEQLTETLIQDMNEFTSIEVVIEQPQMDID